MSIGQAYLDQVLALMTEWKEKGEEAMVQLTNEELHWQPRSESNSIAAIVKHLRGNMLSRWQDFLTTDGEKADRQRDEEFIGGYARKDDVLADWQEGWHVFLQTLADLREDDLEKTVYIRSEPHTVIQAIERQVAHYANHIGQILYIGKQVKNEDWRSVSIPRGQSAAYLQQKRRGNTDNQS